MSDLVLADSTPPAEPTSLQVVQERVQTEQALVQALRGMVQAACVVQIQGRPYVTVTGLTAIARGLGYTVLELSVEHDDQAGGYVARAEVHDSHGRVVGAGSGWVDDLERPWCTRPVFARRAMASTRAAGRALRLVLAPLVVAMGYEATAAEEMPPIDQDQAPPAAAKPAADVVEGVPVVKNRQAGKSKRAYAVTCGPLQTIYVNNSGDQATIDEAESGGRRVQIRWKQVGKWHTAEGVRLV